MSNPREQEIKKTITLCDTEARLGGICPDENIRGTVETLLASEEERVKLLVKVLEEIEKITACNDPCGEFDSERINVWHLANDAIKHPEKLHNLDDAWKDLDAILKDLPDDDADE